MGRFNEHRRQDCIHEDGCEGCVNSPPKGARSKVFKLAGDDKTIGPFTATGRRVVDRNRDLMTYQFDESALVLQPRDLPLVRALLAALDAEEQAAFDVFKAKVDARMKEAMEEQAAARQAQDLAEFDAAHDETECRHGGCEVCRNTCTVGACSEPRQGPGVGESMCVGHDSW